MKMFFTKVSSRDRLSEQYTFSNSLGWELFKVSLDEDNDGIEFWCPLGVEPERHLKDIVKRFIGFGFNGYSEFDLGKNTAMYISKYDKRVLESYNLHDAFNLIEGYSYRFRKMTELMNSLELEGLLDLLV